MLIPAAFLVLIDRVQPTKVEQDRARLHAETIRTRLGSSFKLRRPIVIGSYSRHTAVRGYSDIDLLAILSRQEARWGDGYKRSDAFLGQIKNDLMARYPATDVRRDSQAVVVHFAQGHEGVDVVPGIFWEMTSHKRPLYYIPDGSGEWMPTSPEAHNVYLSNNNIKSGGKWRRTVQLIKFWRECRSPRVPLSSFHLELLLSAEGTCVGPKSYAQCVFEAFHLLVERECRGIRDPVGISGTIPAIRTDAQREVALQSVIYAREHALSALEAESAGNRKEAFRQWNIVFNGFFPAFR